MNQESEDLPFCKCGCGERVTKKGNVWIHNHHRRGKKSKPEPEPILCECGCGEYAKPGRRFISGHNSKVDHPMQGKKHSRDSIKKMSISHIKQHEDPETREKVRQKAIEQWKDPIKRAKLSGENSTAFRHQGKESNAWRGGKVIVKCDTCNNDIERYPSDIKNHNFCNRNCQLKYKNYNRYDTDIEIIVQNALIKKNIEFKTQVNILSYYPDILLPKYNIIIECDGDYWHGNEKILKKLEDWQIKAQNHDKKKDSRLTKLGYTVLRFWENDIKNNIEFCMNRLDLLLGEKNES